MYNLDIEKKYLHKNKILGIDEAGRGACAGPIVVAGVILPKKYKNNLIDDSKKISPKQRQKAFDIIKRDALAYSIKISNSDEVDKLNPKQATRKLMREIVEELNFTNLIITDYETINDINIEQLNLVKGDSQSLTVAAASILAKVFRDNYMQNLDIKYPQFCFGKHKGYCTKLHNELIKRYGVCPEHRKSYKNVINSLLFFTNNKI
ncbi:ribonuclease HII [Mycoplasmopsis phocirhinis]|uniref:Ribonuclease n=1 Tax=Mycoplasmopsis phocirhinis TaxID=142650 RepID=A0A4P6MNU5_9BACT|nr:ribonuclease HII [Mycoplasmopsis phocirhinis]QBF34366.1 ribonuclease HII [Mycoplasmopsis phocirhinis]